MLSAKSVDTMNSLFGPIGRSDNEGLHLGRMLFGVMSFPPELSAMLRRKFSTKGRTRASLTGNAHLLTGFKCGLPAKLSCKAFRRMLHTQVRASDTRDIEAYVTERLELIEPVLFTSYQGHGQNIFQYLKDKGIRAVLVPGALQLGVSVSSARKHMSMILPTATQVDGTPNVEFAVGNTRDAVDTRCGGNGRGHLSNCLSLVALFCVVARMQGSIRSSRLITPTLDNHSDYTFFPSARKAEVRR